MLRYFIQKVHRRRWARPRIVIAVPSGITPVERRAVEEAAYHAGARRAYTIEEPMAAAIGVGLPIGEPSGSMVVDMGGGTTEVAVISLGGIVVSRSIRIGGDELDEAIIEWVKKEYNMLLGERTAEQVKMAIGSAWPYADEPSAEVRGRDLVTGLPKTILLSSPEIREAIEEPTQAIVDAVKFTLDKTPPELAADIMERGIVLTGGGALLVGLDERLAHETGMPIVTARRPLQSVAHGLGQVPRRVRDASLFLRPPMTPPVRPAQSRGERPKVIQERESTRDRTLPTFVTLLVLAFLSMTVDVRVSERRSEPRNPKQRFKRSRSTSKPGGLVVDPVADLGGGLAGLATLRAENQALRAEVARLKPNRLDTGPGGASGGAGADQRPASPRS